MPVVLMAMCELRAHRQHQIVCPLDRSGAAAQWGDPLLTVTPMSKNKGPALCRAFVFDAPRD
jgi:hypothetical protein